MEIWHLLWGAPPRDGPCRCWGAASRLRAADRQPIRPRLQGMTAKSKAGTLPETASTHQCGRHTRGLWLSICALGIILSSQAAHACEHAAWNSTSSWKATSSRLYCLTWHRQLQGQTLGRWCATPDKHAPLQNHQMRALVTFESRNHPGTWTDAVGVPSMGT